MSTLPIPTEKNFNVLGKLGVFENGKPSPLMKSTQGCALIAYLLITNKAHSREHLADLFWGETGSTAESLLKLRKLLYRIRPHMPELEITRQHVAIQPENKTDIDLYTLESALVSENQSQLDQGLALYSGELLSGFYLDQSSTFNEWLTIEREKLRQRVWDGYRQLCAAYHSRQAWQLGVGAAERWLALDPIDEEILRQLFHFLSANGQIMSAVDRYESFRQLLWDELEVEPEPATEDLVAQIQEAAHELIEDQRSLLVFGRQNYWGEAPDTVKFFGRKSELAQLKEWLSISEKPARLITLLGIGGQGKTTLAAQAARTHADQYASVCWRSLINAPPLKSLLSEFIGFLSHGELLPAESLAEQLADVRRYLQQNRCLLVLDNLETVLDGGHAGQFRDGYADYEQLLHLFGQGGHESCLIITSRELPAVVDRLSQQSNQVHSLQLSGLSEQAGLDILVADNLDISPETVALLTKRYSGNPLALKLVAQTIQEFYFGDAWAFLTEETFIFDDIQDVLNQQFQRLSTLEQEILLWMAIIREAATPQLLSSLILKPIRQRDMLEAMRRLQRRSLLEREHKGFTLQNVVTEFLTDVLVDEVSSEIKNQQFDYLNRFALMLAHTKEYIRQSQVRLILDPFAKALISTYGRSRLASHLHSLVNQLQTSMGQTPSYAPGNLLNLMLHLEIELTDCDYSSLNIREAYLKESTLLGVNFTDVIFTNSIFTDDFGNVHAMTFSPDGQVFAAGSKEGIIRLWNRQDGQLEQIFTTGGGSIWALEYSPDGKILAAASADHQIWLWDIQTGQLYQQLAGHSHCARAIGFSPDGQRLVSSSEDHTVRLWDVSDPILTTPQLHIFEEDTGSSFGVAYSPDGHTIAGPTNDFSIRFWDAVTGQVVKTLVGHTDAIESISFSPDGRWLVSGDRAGQVMLWDAHTGKLQHKLEGHTDWIKAVDFHANSQIVASGSRDKTVRLWAVDRGEMLHQLVTTTPVWTICFNPNGESILCGGLDYRMHEWDVATGRLRDVRHGHTNTAMCLTFSQDGKTLVTGHTDGEICFWDVAPQSQPTGKDQTAPSHLRQISPSHDGWVTAVALSHDGKRLVTAGLNGEVYLWDAATASHKTFLVQHNGSVFGCAFSPDDTLLVSAGGGGQAYIWDIQQARLLHTLNCPYGLEQAVISADGHFLITSGAAHSVLVWNLQAILDSGLSTITKDTIIEHNAAAEKGKWVDNAICRTVDGHDGFIFALAIQSDGQMFASGSYDLTLRLWNLPAIAHSNKDGTAPDPDTMQQKGLRNILQGHTGWIWSTAFSPDGTLLASCSEDRTIRIWDVRSGEERLRLQGHTQFVFALAFSPDGKMLVSGSGDKSIRLWDVDSGVCLKTIHKPGPYEGMNIAGAIGLTEAQKIALKTLGALEI